jgi:hypothetical protein
MHSASQGKPTVGALLSELLAECQEDYVGLWVIVSDLEDEAPSCRPEERREMVLDIARRLLEAGMVAGQFSGEAFEVWPLAPDQAIERIRDAWDKLGRNPTLGEICWFTAPEASQASGSE